MSVFSELKRRNVFRVAIAYAVASWVLLQVADLFMGYVDAPDWVMHVLMFFMGLGFIAAMIVSWVYELTPEGIKREKDIQRGASITHITARKLDWIILGFMVIAAAVFAWDRFFPRAPEVDTKVVSAEVAAELEPTTKSIAVLPFRNRSNAAEDQFFVDGIQDDLLTQLARLSTFDKVISRTSTEQYRGSAKPIPQIGKELGVAAVLEGGVQRSGGQVRINVQLIDTASDEHLWARSYDRELTVTNIFDIQTEITREIVAALDGVISSDERKSLQAMPTTSIEAYAEYVLGRQEMTKRTGDSLLRAQDHFKKAIELDPEYVLAYVGLADTYALVDDYLGVRVEDTVEPRQEAIDMALSLDPMSGEAYANLGGLRSRQGRREEAEKYFLRAIELSPNYPTTYHYYNIMLRRVQRDEEALVQLRKAIDLDPAEPILTEALAATLSILGRPEEAKVAVQTGLERNPDFPPFYSRMASLLRNEGRVGDALRWMREAKRLNRAATSYAYWECSLYLDLGDGQSSERCFEAFEKEHPDQNLRWRRLLHRYHERFEEALAYAKEIAERDASRGNLNELAIAHYEIGNIAESRSIFQELTPDFFGSGQVSVKPQDIYEAWRVVHILQLTGEHDRANYLYDQCLQTMRSMHRNRGRSYGIADVAIHAARGDKDKAIAALREAVDMNYRRQLWRLRLPPFNAMREEPEWNAIVVEIETDLALQRQWYEENRDKPLF